MNWILDDTHGIPPIVFIIFAIMFLTLGGQRQQQDDVNYCRNIYTGQVRLTYFCNQNGDRIHYDQR